MKRTAVTKVVADKVYSDFGSGSRKTSNVQLTIVSPWYLNGWIVLPSGGGILALLAASIFFGTRYYAQRSQAQRLQAQMLEQERQARQEIKAQAQELTESNTQLETCLDEVEHLALLGVNKLPVSAGFSNPAGAARGRSEWIAKSTTGGSKLTP